MKNYTTVIQDKFMDYAGKEHKFVVAAVSETFKEDERPDLVNVKGFDADVLGSVIKGVRIGIAICNPEDKYEEKAGVYRAVARAEESDYALLSISRGYINETVIKALLSSEASYIKNNPEQYIAGYAEMRDRYLKNQKMQEAEKNFTEIERIVAEKLEENPKFLDNVNDVLKWRANQKKGKCQKRGK